ncbi:MAG: hypothetical protein QM293_02475 [Bacteroidota bacterium]|jgi:hypothetical protein|nr:hypothetical protein [Bacteroidota bacterium]
MPKPYTFPNLYNEALQIHISKLKAWGYLAPGQIKSGTIDWNRNGNFAGSISIRVNNQGEQPYVELDYQYQNKPRNYKVYLTSTPSNLNRGKIWYFLCPQTNKRCRNLYLIGGYFLHRNAFNNSMYETQTYSKRSRALYKTLGQYLKSDALFNELNKKHFKTKYMGKPTKKYIRIVEQLLRTKSISYNEIEQWLTV